MASIAISAQGTLVQVQTAAGPPAVFTTIKGINSFDGFDGQRSETDVTDFESTAKEYRLGLKDNGTFRMRGFRSDGDTGQAKVSTDLGATTSTPWKITLPDTHTYTFNAFVRSYTVSASVDNPLGMEITLRIDGAVTYT